MKQPKDALDRSQSLFYFVPQEKNITRNQPVFSQDSRSLMSFTSWAWHLNNLFILPIPSMLITKLFITRIRDFFLWTLHVTTRKPMFTPNCKSWRLNNLFIQEKNITVKLARLGWTHLGGLCPSSPWSSPTAAVSPYTVFSPPPSPPRFGIFWNIDCQSILIISSYRETCLPSLKLLWYWP